MGYLCLFSLSSFFSLSLCLFLFCLPLLPSVFLFLSLTFPHSPLHECLSLCPVPICFVSFYLPPFRIYIHLLFVRLPKFSLPLTLLSLACISLTLSLPLHLHMLLLSHFLDSLSSHGSPSLCLCPSLSQTLSHPHPVHPALGSPSRDSFQITTPSPTRQAGSH